MTLGTGIHGAIGITEAGTTLGTAGTTLGSTEDIGVDGMTHGITDTADGTADIGDRTTQDGMADGTRIGDIITDGIPDITAMDTDLNMLTLGEALGIRPAQTRYSQAAHHCEGDSAPHRHPEETFLQMREGPPHARQRLRPAG